MENDKSKTLSTGQFVKCKDLKYNWANASNR